MNLTLTLNITTTLDSQNYLVQNIARLEIQSPLNISTFFTVNLLNTLVIETSRYAGQFFRNNPVVRNRMKDWDQVSLGEMKAFIAIVFNMGIIRKPSIRS